MASRNPSNGRAPFNGGLNPNPNQAGNSGVRSGSVPGTAPANSTPQDLGGNQPQDQGADTVQEVLNNFRAPAIVFTIGLALTAVGMFLIPLLPIGLIVLLVSFALFARALVNGGGEAVARASPHSRNESRSPQSGGLNIGLAAMVGAYIADRFRKEGDGEKDGMGYSGPTDLFVRKAEKRTGHIKVEPDKYYLLRSTVSGGRGGSTEGWSLNGAGHTVSLNGVTLSGNLSMGSHLVAAPEVAEVYAVIDTSVPPTRAFEATGVGFPSADGKIDLVTVCFNLTPYILGTEDGGQGMTLDTAVRLANNTSEGSWWEMVKGEAITAVNEYVGTDGVTAEGLQQHSTTHSPRIQTILEQKLHSRGIGCQLRVTRVGNVRAAEVEDVRAKVEAEVAPKAKAWGEAGAAIAKALGEGIKGMFDKS